MMAILFLHYSRAFSKTFINDDPSKKASGLQASPSPASL
jgi:hypothetical protein